MTLRRTKECARFLDHLYMTSEHEKERKKKRTLFTMNTTNQSVRAVHAHAVHARLTERPQSYLLRPSTGWPQKWHTFCTP